MEIKSLPAPVLRRAALPLFTATVAAIVALTATAAAPQQLEKSAGAPAAASTTIEFILDASGSMNAKLADGQTRFDAARAAMTAMIDGLPETTSIGLRVYGHQSKTSERNCQDTELVSPFGRAPDRAPAIRGAIAKLKALGYTPISLSLQRAAEDLANEPGPGRTIIIVSDGRETCASDPCAVAQALARANVSLVVHTVGFGVDDAARRQLQCIASVARGSYFNANSMAELTGRLSEAARLPAKPTAPPPSPPRKAVPQVGVLTIKGIDEAGVEVVNSTTNEHAGVVGTVGSNRLELPAGIYGIRFINGLWTGVEIKAGTTTEISPAYLQVKNPAQANISFIDPETGEEVGAIFQKAVPIVALVPGRYLLRSSSDFEFGEFEFRSDATTVVNPALLRIIAGKDSHGYSITSLTTGARGTDVIKGEDVSLPAGRYVVADPDDADVQPVEILLNEGELREIRIGTNR